MAIRKAASKALPRRIVGPEADPSAKDGVKKGPAGAAPEGGPLNADALKAEIPDGGAAGPAGANVERVGETPLPISSQGRATGQISADNFGGSGGLTQNDVRDLGAVQTVKGSAQLAALNFGAESKKLQGQIKKLGMVIHRGELKGAKEARATNQPSPDLFGKEIESLVAQINTPEMKAQCDADPVLAPLRNQLEMAFQHVRMEVLEGPFPFQPCIAALKETQLFLSVLDATATGKAEGVSVAAPASPGQMQAELEELGQADSAQAKAIIKAPLEHYQAYSARLATDGPEAKFPEYGNLVRIMELHASDTSVLELCETHPGLAVMRQDALEGLAEVQAEGFPYRKTLDALEGMVAFQDIYDRARPGGTQTPLYHSKRWKYHAHHMKAETPEYVMMPTQHSLGVTDLLKVRGVPLGFVGVSSTPMWVDGHSQSPLEFFFHDFNHSRRMWQQFGDLAKLKGLSIGELAEQSNKFVWEEIMPGVTPKKSDSPEVKNLKRIKKVLLFEVCHEDALPADRDTIRDSLRRKPYEISPFVFEVQSNDDPPKVAYEHGPNATVESFVYRKLAGEFYDMSEMRIKGLGDPEVRTRDFVMKSAKDLNAQLGLGIPEAQLEANVLDDSGLPDDFRTKCIKMLDADPTCMDPFVEDAARAAGADV